MAFDYSKIGKTRTTKNPVVSTTTPQNGVYQNALLSNTTPTTAPTSTASSLQTPPISTTPTALLPQQKTKMLEENREQNPVISGAAAQPATESTTNQAAGYFNALSNQQVQAALDRQKNQQQTSIDQQAAIDKQKAESALAAQTAQNAITTSQTQLKNDANAYALKSNDTKTAVQLRAEQFQSLMNQYNAAKVAKDTKKMASLTQQAQKLGLDIVGGATINDVKLPTNYNVIPADLIKKYGQQQAEAIYQQTILPLYSQINNIMAQVSSLPSNSDIKKQAENYAKSLYLETFNKLNLELNQAVSEDEAARIGLLENVESTKKNINEDAFNQKQEAKENASARGLGYSTILSNMEQAVSRAQSKQVAEIEMNYNNKVAELDIQINKIKADIEARRTTATQQEKLALDNKLQELDAKKQAAYNEAMAGISNAFAGIDTAKGQKVSNASKVYQELWKDQQSIAESRRQQEEQRKYQAAQDEKNRQFQLQQQAAQRKYEEEQAKKQAAATAAEKAAAAKEKEKSTYYKTGNSLTTNDYALATYMIENASYDKDTGLKNITITKAGLKNYSATQLRQYAAAVGSEMKYNDTQITQLYNYLEKVKKGTTTPSASKSIIAVNNTTNPLDKYKLTAPAPAMSSNPIERYNSLINSLKK